MRASGLTLAFGWGRYYRKYGFMFAFEWLTFAVVLALASVLVDERFRIVAVVHKPKAVLGVVQSPTGNSDTYIWRRMYGQS